MSAPTKIEWTDRVWNPVTGCERVSDGCANCYAERIAHRFWGDRGFNEVREEHDRLADPLHLRRPSRIFVNSMSDLFHGDVSRAFIDRVFAAMALAERHTFQILTKRPYRMSVYLNQLAPTRFGDLNDAARALTGDEYAPAIFPTQRHGMVPQRWPLPNVWLGVSVEDTPAALSRIPSLLSTPAAVRFVSVEPMLSRVDLGEVLGALDWVICGGETGPGARPFSPDWARELRDACASAGVPFFFKQMDRRRTIPRDLLVREFPSTEGVAR